MKPNGSASSESGIPLEFDRPIITPGKGRIQRFEDIPDIFSLEIPPIEYIVPALGIARNTITLWTGSDGDGKTFLAQAMAVAVARGAVFLGMNCQRCPALYLDLENAAYMVQDRLTSLVADEPVTTLRVWGIWNEQQPPQAGSDLLLTIAKETKPLIVIDPFRYFHKAEENDSTEMSGIMQYLRACAAYGSAVVLLHHPAKAEGSTGRGSSAIRGACDLAFLHSLDKEGGLITLKVDKNRNGESRTITIRADFEQGGFELADSPLVTRRNEELAQLEQIIRDHPGITQNGILEKCGGRKCRIGRLLKEGTGSKWVTQPGAKRSTMYYARDCFPVVGTGGNHRNLSSSTSDTGSRDPARVSENSDNKAMSNCSTCGGFAIYREASGKIACMSCGSVEAIQ